MDVAERYRVTEIDGIRGWASVSVFLFHLLAELFGILRPEFRSMWTHFLLNGHLAVMIFFVLSGDALATVCSQGNNRVVLNYLVVKRYFRLTAPIALSCFLVFVLMKLHLVFPKQAGIIVHREDWIGQFIPFEASIITFIKFVFLGVYNIPLNNPYNPFLWPMSYELMASMYVFIYLFIAPRLRWPLLTLFTIIFYLAYFKSYCTLFFIGVTFAKLRSMDFFERAKKSTTWMAISTLALPILVIFEFKIKDGPLDYDSRNMIVAVLFVFLIYSSNWMTHIFRAKVSVFLGDISFPLYLLHFAVLVSFTSGLIVYFSKNEVLSVGYIYFILASTIIITGMLAIVFSRIEKYLLRVITRLARQILTIDSFSVANIQK
jgi:peptidoglycan/LPS O-acetylase OafA/YrhL